MSDRPVCDACLCTIEEPGLGVVQWDVDEFAGTPSRVRALNVAHKGECAEIQALPFWIELSSLADPRDAIATLCNLLAYRWEREHLERLIRIAGALSPEGAEALRRVG